MKARVNACILIGAITLLALFAIPAFVNAIAP
jgi:hypothetical protein